MEGFGLQNKDLHYFRRFLWTSWNSSQFAGLGFLCWRCSEPFHGEGMGAEVLMAVPKLRKMVVDVKAAKAL